MIRSPRILSWRWGRVVVEDVPRPLRDVALFPGGAREWDWRESHTGHRAGVQPRSVAELVDHGARIVVLGTGVLGFLRVAPATMAFLAREGVVVHVLRTPDAVRRYNTLVTTGPVGALIHSTC
ncbi:MAG TPA: MTH938/NDUFAF3 family protein [Gemmatimonadaceae bacterium]|nr:MTH938/NDUFAF3 family protein [Gemmatimonadaceae bacterium]